AEETIFAPAATQGLCDGFEVQHLVLDCNAEHVPKYTRGEPVWIRIPLASPGRVDSVTLRWASEYIQGLESWTGRPAELQVCARQSGTNVYVTNCVSVFGAGLVDTVGVGTNADELVLVLLQRGVGVDYYALKEIQVQGPAISLASAAKPDGGESR